MTLSDVRKFAQERSISYDAGSAYGLVNGWHVALNQSNNTTALHIYLYPPIEKGQDNGERDAQILNVLTNCDLKKYRLNHKNGVRIEAGIAHLTFANKLDIMKRIADYIDNVLPALNTLDLDGHRCAFCGNALNDDVHYIQLDGNIMPVHSECRAQLSSTVDKVEDEPRPGSVLKGVVGALCGAILGAILYAIVFYAGYIAGLVGLLSGFLVSVLYDKFGGKRSKWKLPVVAVMLVLSILLGQIAGYTLLFNQGYDEAGLTEADYSRKNYIVELWEEYLLYDQETALSIQYERLTADLSEEALNSGLYMTEDDFIETYYNTALDTQRAEMREEFQRNFLMGLFYAVLATVGIFYKIYLNGKRRKVYELK